MKRKYNHARALLILVLSAFAVKGYSQMVITGPVCVTRSTEYAYAISGIQTGAQDMQVCIGGGLISGTDSSCHRGIPVSFIKVIWTDSVGGSITISGTAGNASLHINITGPLTGGRIDTLRRIQIITAGAVPDIVHCTEATGGYCSPRYVYQWQQSADGMHWSIITGAVSKDLPFSSTVTSTVYYRRKVTDARSTTETYSDIAIISVHP